MIKDVIIPPNVELPIEFSLLLSFNQIREFIVGHDLIVFSVALPNFQEELDLLVILSVAVLDLFCDMGPDGSAIGFIKEYAEAQQVSGCKGW